MKGFGFAKPEIKTIPAPNGMPLKVARCGNKYYVETESGSLAIGKASDRLQPSVIVSGLKLVTIPEYTAFLQQEAFESDNFEARQMLTEFSMFGIKRSTKNGVLTLPTGDKIRVDEDGMLSLTDLCKALGVSEKEAIEVIEKIQERGY